MAALRSLFSSRGLFRGMMSLKLEASAPLRHLSTAETPSSSGTSDVLSPFPPPEPEKLLHSRFANIKAELFAFQKRIGVQFNNTSLLHEALTIPSLHPSFNHHKLAVLGGDLLNLTVNEALQHRFPLLPHAGLQILKDELMNDAAVRDYAFAVGLNHVLIGDLKERQRGKTDNHARSFKALVGAIYLDQGADKATEFARTLWEGLLRSKDIESYLVVKNVKATLDDYMLATQRRVTVDLKHESGRGTHNPTFVVALSQDGVPVAEGAGWSIKMARNDAFMTALRDVLCVEDLSPSSSKMATFSYQHLMNELRPSPQSSSEKEHE